MIDNNLKIFTEEFEKLKGQFVLCNNRAERLIGLFSDDWDYYWVLYTDEGLRLVSGLFRITQLKDKIDSNDYNDMVRVAKLNDFDLVEGVDKEYVENLKQQLIDNLNGGEGDGEMILGPCWDIN